MCWKVLCGFIIFFIIFRPDRQTNWPTDRQTPLHGLSMEALFLLPIISLEKRLIEATFGSKVLSSALNLLNKCPLQCCEPLKKSIEILKILRFAKYCKNTLKIDDYRKSLLLCQYICNQSLDLYEISHFSSLNSNWWPKNDRNGSMRQSRSSKSLAEYVQRHVCFVNIQLSLHENIVFSVCACMSNAAYIIFIMWNSFSGLEVWYHFWVNISCGMAVTVRSHQQKFQVNF